MSLRRASLLVCVLAACGEQHDAGTSAHLLTTPVIAAGAEWRYWDRGGDLGTAWRMGTYDDSAWARGAGPLGYGESYLRTIVSYGPSSSSKYITTYVRRTFVVDDPAAVIGMRARLMYDDGVVVHLNGAELARVAMTSGTITASTYSSGHEASNTYASLDWSASTGLLLPGINTIAVEIHQSDPGSSDLVFDLALDLELASEPTPGDGGITRNATWWYWDNGGDLGTAWRTATGGSGWEAGEGVFGYGESYIDTAVSYGASSSQKHVTTYFTTAFEVDDAASVTSMIGEVMYDDGFVAYLNGAELGRAAMTSGTVTASTYSTGHEASNAYVTFDWSGRRGLLRDGTNILAVEIHQVDASSSDLVFDLALDLDVAAAPPVGDDGITPNATWWFWDRGGDLGTAWRTSAGGSGWRSGAGVLGYGESYIDTPVAYGATSSQKHITTYFTTAFAVDDAAAVTSMVGEVMYDDGFVAYLNGAELGRAAMTSGTITASTLSSGHEANDAYVTFDWSSRRGLLRDGTNILAVEVHQQSASSSDLVFDLALALERGTSSGWPGADAVAVADAEDDLGGDLSDIFLEPGVMWTVNNYRGALVKLVPSGSGWNDASTRILRYPGGGGHPDSEGVTRAELTSSAIYVSAERNNDASSTSRLSVLRYDTAASGSELIATHEWNLTSYLPAASANSGLEAIRWIPDSALVAGGFFDERAGRAYVPSAYPGHGTGVFLVGVEGTGAIHAFALDHATGARHRLATFPSGLPRIMALEVDRDTGRVWAHCDSACGNRTNVLALDGGRFRVVAELPSPTSMPSSVDNEGIAIEPASACVAGQRRFYWCDETAYDGHVLRFDLVPCAP